MILAGNRTAGDRITIAVPIPGNCPVCGVRHREDKPHKLNSLWYQNHFYHEHGRYPTAEDAMSHCTERIKVREREKAAKKLAEEAGIYD